MRILQVIQSLKLGGAERVCLDLSTELVKMGHVVRIILLQDLQISQKSEPTIDLDIRPLVRNEQPIWVKAIPKLAMAFRHHLAEQWDVVHCHMDGALTIAAAGGATNIVYTVHNSKHGHWEGVGLHRLRSFFEWSITQRKNVIVTACGPGAREWSYDHLAAGTQPRCISNGIYMAKFPFMEKPWQPERPIKILMVGKFTQSKDHVTALKALNSLVEMGINVELNLVGSGSEEATLRTVANELGVGGKVRFHGISTNTLPYYQQADVFWLTSRHEGLPIVLLEAAAVGLPIVATNVPGIKELFADLSVLSISEGDYLRLAEVTNMALSMPDTIERMRYNNRLQIERLFSSTRMAESYVSIYSTML